MALVVIARDGCLLDRPVDALALAVGPGVVRFCQAMITAVLRTGQDDGVAAKQGFLGAQLLELGGLSSCRPLDP